MNFNKVSGHQWLQCILFFDFPPLLHVFKVWLFNLDWPVHLHQHLVSIQWKNFHVQTVSKIDVFQHLKTNSPNSERTPQEIHTIRDIPMLPEFCRIPFGEMKMPAPMMMPTMIEIPRSSVTFFLSSTFWLSAGDVDPFTCCKLFPLFMMAPSIWGVEDFSHIFLKAKISNSACLTWSPLT